jgi:hypothetical protein
MKLLLSFAGLLSIASVVMLVLYLMAQAKTPSPSLSAAAIHQQRVAYGYSALGLFLGSLVLFFMASGSSQYKDPYPDRYD